MKNVFLVIALTTLGCEQYDQYYDVREILVEGKVEHCFEGSVCTSNPNSIYALKDYDCITGDVNLRMPTQTDVDAVSHLRQIGGVLNVSYSDSVTTIDFPLLWEVGGMIDILNNESLEEISFKNLEYAGSLMVQSNPLLVELEAPALIEIDKQFTERLNESFDVSNTCELFEQLEAVPGGFQVDEWENCDE